MKTWLLKTQDELFKINDSKFETLKTSDSSFPCILSPSINYRKYLTIPSDTTREPEIIRLELLKKSLPKSPDEVKYQFLELGSDDNENKRVLALALDQDKFDVIKDNELYSELYFFETVLTAEPLNEPQLLEVEFPQGMFFGVFNRTLLWSRFIHERNEKQTSMTKDYVQNEFEFDLQLNTIKPFYTEDDLNEKWPKQLSRFLTSKSDQTDDLLSDTGANIQGFEWVASTLGILLIISSVIWITHQKITQSKLRDWSQRTYSETMGNSVSSPYETAKNKLKEMEEKLATNRKPPYPRFVFLDEQLQNIPFRLLRVTIQDEETTLIGLTENVSSVGSLRDKLSESDRVLSVTIQSTNTIDFRKFNYRVKLLINWK